MELVNVQVTPDDNRFVWETEVMIENFIGVGYRHELHNLVYIPYNRKPNKLFKKLQAKYKDKPYIKFFFYKGTKSLASDIDAIQYIPLLRPYCLAKHFRKHRELEGKAIFYHDSDILWTKKLDFTPFIQEDDDTCYLSYTGDYLNFDYLIGKIHDVRPEKIMEVLDNHMLEVFFENFGLTVQMLKANNANTGGAQSLLKNITYHFWQDVYRSCMIIKPYFNLFNQMYMKGNDPQERERNGYQSWALADMGGLIWNLWKRGIETRCPKELDFAWATDERSRLKDVYIFHNAGVVDEEIEVNGVKHPIFYKSKFPYVNNQKSPHMEKEYLCAVSNKFASSFYVDNLLNVQNPVY